MNVWEKLQATATNVVIDLRVMAKVHADMSKQLDLLEWIIGAVPKSYAAKEATIDQIALIISHFQLMANGTTGAITVQRIRDNAVMLNAALNDCYGDL